jgi:hypothetical protein
MKLRWWKILEKAISDVLERQKSIHVLNGSGFIIGDVFES